MEHLVLLEAGGSEWALPVALVREIAPHAPPRPVPDAPGHVAGVVNLHGRILPVVDLRDRAGESGVRPAGAALVVAALPEGLVAVAVDAVGDVVVASPRRGRPRGLPLAEGVARLHGGREVVVLDLARLAGGAVAAPAAPARAQKVFQNDRPRPPARCEPPPAVLNASRCGVLGRGDAPGIAPSLRPCLARFSRQDDRVSF